MQSESIQRLTELIAELFPVIISVLMIMLVVGVVASMMGGRNKKRGGLLAFIFVLSLLLSATLVSAAASVSPGSTSVYDNMPVTETFRGLSDADEYQLLQLIGEEIGYDSLYCDSAGILIVTVTPYKSGSNPYVLEFENGTDVLTFTIQNNSIMDYLIPLFVIMIMVSILGLIMSIFTGKR